MHVFHSHACVPQSCMCSTVMHVFHKCGLMLCFPDIKLGPSPSELSPRLAIRILPIAQQYDFCSIQSWCEEAFQRSQLDLWPSDPIASSEVLNHPGLVQCLALADAKQCDTVVQSCLSQLIKPGADETIRGALASPYLYKMMDGLRSETKTHIICRMAGLPKNHKVRTPVLCIPAYYTSAELSCPPLSGIYPGHWQGRASGEMGA